MKSDTQRTKVYKWERKYIPKVWKIQLATHEVEDLIERIAFHYKLVPPAFKLRRMKGWAGTYAAYNNTLTLNPITGLNAGTVYHEMAHAVCAGWRKRLGMVVDDGGHGDFFMASYLDVLETFAGLGAMEIEAIRLSLDPESYTGEARRSVPKVAACAVYEDPRESPEQARRSMRCIQCNYPWVRHDMPFHCFNCAERFLVTVHQLPTHEAGLAPSKWRAKVLTAALEATRDLRCVNGRWYGTESLYTSSGNCIYASGLQAGALFRPTIADHKRKGKQNIAGCKSAVIDYSTITIDPSTTNTI